MIRTLYFLSGLLCLVAGIIGVFLPLLPTTPFLILALILFAESSPRFHRMLLNNRWFGPALQQWEKDRSISRGSKRKAMLLVVLTFAISITLLHEKPALQLMLLALMSALLVFLWRLRESPATPPGD